MCSGESESESCSGQARKAVKELSGNFSSGQSESSVGLFLVLNDAKGRHANQSWRWQPLLNSHFHLSLMDGRPSVTV